MECSYYYGCGAFCLRARCHLGVLGSVGSLGAVAGFLRFDELGDTDRKHSVRSASADEGPEIARRRGVPSAKLFACYLHASGYLVATGPWRGCGADKG